MFSGPRPPTEEYNFGSGAGQGIAPQSRHCQSPIADFRLAKFASGQLANGNRQSAISYPVATTPGPDIELFGSGRTAC